MSRTKIVGRVRLLGTVFARRAHPCRVPKCHKCMNNLYMYMVCKSQKAHPIDLLYILYPVTAGHKLGGRYRYTIMTL